jgi:hypothetical protein
MLGFVEVELTSKASSWKGCRVAYTAALPRSTAAEEGVIPALIITVDSTPPRRAERLRAAIFDAGDSPLVVGRIVVLSAFAVIGDGSTRNTSASAIDRRTFRKAVSLYPRAKTVSS